jgi:hypothetical protein
MAKSKKKVQKRGKLRKANSAKPSKTRKVARAKTVSAKAKAKPKRASVKKTARKVKQSAPVIEGVAVEAVEQSAPGVITVAEVEEARQLN